MSSSLPFYTLKICVLISPGSEKGVAWPAPCPGLCRAFFLEAVIGASHQKRGPEWRAGLNTAHGSLPVSHTHTPRISLLRGGYPGLCTRTQLCAGPCCIECRLENAEKQCLHLLTFRTSDPIGLPPRWRPFWWWKPRFMGAPYLGPAVNKPSIKGHFPGSQESWAAPGYQVTLACDNSIEIMWKTVHTIHAEVFTSEKLKLSGTR